MNKVYCECGNSIEVKMGDGKRIDCSCGRYVVIRAVKDDPRFEYGYMWDEIE